MELRKLTENISLSEAVKRYFSAIDAEIDDETLDYLAKSGKIVFLLDGFDEIENKLIKPITLEIEHLARKYENLQIVVSSRPDNEVQKLNSFRVVDIAKLNPDDYFPFLISLGVDATKSSEIVHAIKESPSRIIELVNTPLMLTLVVFVYQSENQIPSDLPEFFERLFHTVFTKHDKLKDSFIRNHHSGLSERRLQMLFEAFCFMALQGGQKRSLSNSQFNECFDLAQEYTSGCSCDEDAFKKDITKVACLMLEEGINEITFLHKSIAEYYAASFIKNSDEPFAITFYKEALKSWDHWYETLNFLQAIDPYRFAKHFAIPNITKSLEILGKVSDCKDGADLCKKLPSWLKNSRLEYSFRDGDYYMDIFGPFNSPPTPQLKDFYSYSSNLSGAIPPILSISEVATLRQEGVQIFRHNNDSISIPFGYVVSLWNFDEFMGNVKQTITRLQKSLEDAKELADKMADRPKIFQRRKRQD